MNPILIVEDDNDINNLIATILKRAGYIYQQAYSGTEAKLLLDAQKFSLLVLDLMLPGLTGEELIQHVRKTNTVPVIILSAKDRGVDKVNLLKLGADDYMTKPFDADELIARVEALFRRTQIEMDGPMEKILTYKNIELNKDSHKVFCDQEEINLTAREFAILELFMEHPNKVYTKANVYESVWNDEFFGDDNTINVHISNLRTKLKDKNIIQTVWGIGFKMQE